MNDNNEIRKDKKYEVAFFTLLGFVLVVSISTLAFVISSNKDKTKKNDEKIISNKIDSSNETYIYEESNTNIDNTSNNTSNTTSNKINTLSDTEISNTDDKVISYLTEKQKDLADVNDDGNVDILDAADIQKYASEIITEFKKK